MGNLRHRGFGSNSLWGLCNKHTNYNLNDGADVRIFYCRAAEFRLHFLTGFFIFQTFKNERVWGAIGNQEHALLTCIWSSEEGRSGCGGIESPSADMSHPLVWHSLCLGNRCPFPGCKTSSRWRLCRHWGLSLRGKNVKVSESMGKKANLLKQKKRKKEKVRCVNCKLKARMKEWGKELGINPLKNVSCLT